MRTPIHYVVLLEDMDSCLFPLAACLVSCSNTRLVLLSSIPTGRNNMVVKLNLRIVEYVIIVIDVLYYLDRLLCHLLLLWL